MASISAQGVASVLLWFFFNISISNINKWLFTKLEFQYPVFLTCCHMIMCYVLSGLYLQFVRPTAAPPSARTLRGVYKLSVSFCISVACGNIALNYVYVSFAQMIGSTTPLVTVLLSAAMQGKRHHHYVWLSLLPVTAGAMLCVNGEINFHWIGFVAVAMATVMRAVKSITGAVLLTDKDRLDSITLLHYMSKPSIFILAACALLLGEGSMVNDPVWLSRDTIEGVLVTLLLSSLNAFFVNLFNFLVTFHTNAVTLQVLGSLKVVIAIVVSVLIYRNEISTVSQMGCVLILGGVFLYNRVKSRSGAKKLQTDKLDEDADDEHEQRLLSSGNTEEIVLAVRDNGIQNAENGKNPSASPHQRAGTSYSHKRWSTAADTPSDREASGSPS